MKEISLFSCIFILVLTQVKANSTCIASSEKDKKTKSVNLIREMPPLRDQGETGWCYSFVASDLLTHYLHKTKGKHVQGNNVLATDYQDKDSSVSAVGIAAMYNQNYNKNYTEYLYGLDSKELKKMNKKIVPSGGQIADSIDNVKKYGFCLERDVSSSDLSYKEGQRPMSGNFRILQRLNYIYDSPDCDTCKDYKPIQQVFPGLGLKDISIIVWINTFEAS